MSQRHKIVEQGAAANGEVHGQGVVAPGLVAQVDPSNPNVLTGGPGYKAAEVPTGPPGGPLQGSTLTGPIPEDFVPPVDPPNPPSLTLTSITPNTTAVGVAVSATLAGTGFPSNSEVRLDGSSIVSAYVSETELTADIPGPLAEGTVQVTVYADGQETAALPFTATAAALQQQGSGREFPVGPFDIASITGDGELLSITVPPDSDVQAGDSVTIEATGNTSVNGTYTVGSVTNNVVVVQSDVALATPIEAKGRLIVTEGG